MLALPPRIDHQPQSSRFDALVGFARLRATSREEATDVLRKLAPWRFKAPALLAVLIALWYFGGPLLPGPVITVDPVVRADFVQSIVASGHVEAPFRVSVGSQITGVVTEVPVAEGQTVRAGDTLVVLDDREARAGVAQAEGGVAQAEARLRQLKELTLPAAEESLKQARATLANAEETHARAATLEGHGYATKATLSDAIKALDIARAQVRSAQFQVFTNRPGGSDFVMAETQLNQARSNLATAQSKLSYTRITAPRDGVLISRTVERGNVVQPSMVLMALSPLVETQIVVLIDEKNLALIKIGQKALASAEAFARESFPAEVVYINPGIDLQRASVQVKLRVPQPPPYLRQDMTVSVDIETARHPVALIIPAADVRGQASGKPHVLAIEGRRVVRKPVTVGLVGGGKAEIVEGLRDTDSIVPMSATVQEGRRVRARAAPPKAS